MTDPSNSLFHWVTQLVMGTMDSYGINLYKYVFIFYPTANKKGKCFCNIRLNIVIGYICIRITVFLLVIIFVDVYNLRQIVD